MKNGLFSSMAALLTGAGLSFAQAPALSNALPLPGALADEKAPEAAAPKGAHDKAPEPDYPNLTPLAPTANPGGGFSDDCCCMPRPRVWASAEYLLWWVKDASLPPLATSVSSADAAAAAAAGQVPGAIGSIGTQVISPAALDFGTFSGMRATLGAFTRTGRIGFETSGFLLESRSPSFQAVDNVANDPAGPFLGIPFINASDLPPVSDSGLAGIPGLSNGQVSTADRLRLWGAEANGLVRLGSSERFQVAGLAGFRYLDLSEDLRIRGSALVPNGPLAGFEVTRTDRFSTQNHFYGGQLGCKGEWNGDRLFAALTAKVALGQMHESVNANGATTIGGVPGLPSGQFPGGFFTQPSNLGRRTHDSFAVIPQVTAQLGVNLRPNVRAFVGYDFLYVSEVVRPGDQIDPQINLSQQQGQPLMGPALPAPRNHESDFWTHGVSFGLGIRF